MIVSVSQQRWEEAQAAELSAITYQRDQCKWASRHIFQYLGINEDQEGKTIIELGCGAYPATSFVVNVEPVLIEPLEFQSLRELPGLCWLKAAFEDTPAITADEVWIFNCLQHVRDPELVINKAKEAAPVVRFFESVDYPTCVYHPHTFSQSDFERWFPSSVKRYTDRLPGFFERRLCLRNL